MPSQRQLRSPLAPGPAVRRERRRRDTGRGVSTISPERAGQASTATHGREELLFRRYRDADDLAAREELVRLFLPLARQLAWRYHRRAEPLEDLIQVASVGLVKAIDRYDVGRGGRFRSFAIPTMLGELRRHFRDTGWALHVPRGMKERTLSLNEGVERLSREHGRSPTTRELANELEASVEDVLEVMEAGAAYRTVSLDAPIGSDEPGGMPLSETVGEVDPRLEFVDQAGAVARALRALPERERRMLRLRFAEGLTQTEIAERMGISQMHVSRLIRRSLDRMRLVANAEEVR